MRTIYKYPVPKSHLENMLPATGTFRLEIPKNAKFLFCENKTIGAYSLFMWFEVNTVKPLEERYFKAFETGESISGNLGSTDLVYLQSVIFQTKVHDSYEYHFYELL